jgi:hypothetical protein
LHEVRCRTLTCLYQAPVGGTARFAATGKISFFVRRVPFSRRLWRFKYWLDGMGQ